MGGDEVINAQLRQVWDRVIRPVGRGLARSGITPNQITYLGVAVQIASAVFILQGRLLVAGLVGIVAGVSDFLDGAVAKARGTPSKFGAFLDSTTDRLSDAPPLSSGHDPLLDAHQPSLPLPLNPRRHIV